MFEGTSFWEMRSEAVIHNPMCTNFLLCTYIYILYLYTVIFIAFYCIRVLTHEHGGQPSGWGGVFVLSNIFWHEWQAESSPVPQKALFNARGFHIWILFP